MQYLDYQMQSLINLVLSGPGMVLVGIYILFCIFAITKPWARWVALVILLFTTLMSRPSTALETRVDVDLMFPFETIRLHGRTISSIMVIALLLPAFGASTGWRKAYVPLGVSAFLIFQLAFSSMEMVSVTSTRNVLSVFLYMATFVALGVGVSKWLQSPQDVNRVLWAVVTCLVIWVGVNLMQIVVDQNAVARSGRFRGTTANPQFAAVALGACLPIIYYLLLDKLQSKWRKILLSVLLGFLVIMLYWTGSRTGMLMAAVGTLLFFRLRLGRLFVVGVVAAACSFIAIQFIGEDSTQHTERYLSLHDSRSHVWARQWDIFTSSPIVGSFGLRGVEFKYSGGENSYLAVAASYGVVGLIPLLVMMAVMGYEMTRAWFVRHADPSLSTLADMVIAIGAAAAIGAFFEIFLLGQFNFVVFLLFLCSSIAVYIREVAEYVGTPSLPDSHLPYLPDVTTPEYSTSGASGY